MADGLVWHEKRWNPTQLMNMSSDEMEVLRIAIQAQAWTLVGLDPYPKGEVRWQSDPVDGGWVIKWQA